MVARERCVHLEHIANELVVGVIVRDVIEDDRGLEEGQREDPRDFGDAQHHDSSYGQIERIAQSADENKGKSAGWKKSTASLKYKQMGTLALNRSSFESGRKDR